MHKLPTRNLSNVLDAIQDNPIKWHKDGTHTLQFLLHSDSYVKCKS